MPLNTFEPDDLEDDTPEDQDVHPCSTAKLEALKNGNPLRSYVIDYFIDDQDTSESRKHFIRKLLELGCVQGAVTPLIYEKDIHAFYDRFQTEIDQLCQEYEQETGQPIRLGDDRKQGAVWFAFEQTAAQIAGELGIS